MPNAIFFKVAVGIINPQRATGTLLKTSSLSGLSKLRRYNPSTRIPALIQSGIVAKLSTVVASTTLSATSGDPSK